MFKNKEESIKFLVDCGMLINFNDKEFYHGRSRRDNEWLEWSVNPKYNNGGNATGNKNLNSVSTLYVAEKDVAAEFAEARALRDGGTPELHRILSVDGGALLFNSGFSMNGCSDEDKKKIREALKWLSNYSVTALAPIRFELRRAGHVVIDALKKTQIDRNLIYFTEDDIQETINYLDSQGARYVKELVYQIAESYNSKQIMKCCPNIGLERYMSNEPNVNLSDKGVLRLNLDWIAAWLANNHIIGEKSNIYSATLGRELESYSIFDRSKVNTRKRVVEKLQSVDKEFGEVISVLSNFTTDKEMMEIFSKSTPKETMDFIRRIPKYNNIMNMTTGVWEGFTVGEHTESVLRVLEDSFDGDIPDALMPFMKMIIISHDIGKGYAINGSNQHIYTDSLCEDLHARLRIHSQFSKLIRFVVMDSQQYTSNYYVRKNRYAMGRLSIECKKFLTNLLGREPSEGVVRGVVGLAKVLQTCDSGAYTRYGITRDSGNLYYFNGSDNFTMSMQKPKDLKGVKQRFDMPQM